MGLCWSNELHLSIVTLSLEVQIQLLPPTMSIHRTLNSSTRNPSERLGGMSAILDQLRST